MRTISKSAVAGLAIVGSLAAGVSQGYAAIRATSAVIDGGKLVITGKSPTGSSVKLDDKYTAKIKASDRTFKFSVTFLPTDCKGELTLVGATAPAVQEVIAECGQAGPSYIGRRTFDEVVMSLQTGVSSSITSFSFNPPVSGNALIQGRGHCIVAGVTGASTKFHIFAAPDLVAVPARPDYAPVRVNEDPDDRDHLTNWTFETVLPVIEGVAQEVYIRYSTEVAAVAEAECSGSVTVQPINGNLPLPLLP